MPANKTNGSTSLAPAPLGNQRARTHGFYSALTPLDNTEITKVADVLRDLCPLDSDTLEPAIQMLAAQMWRLRRGYADLAEHGVVRGRRDRGRVAPMWAAVDRLEGSILDGLKELGMTSRSAAGLGLQLKQIRATGRNFDASRLTEPERRKLDQLLGKAEVP